MLRANELTAELITSDSVSYLSSFGPQIEFLYLDSYDFDPSNPAPSQTHALNEAKAALPRLSDNAVIMIDDVGLEHGGKGGLVIPYLLERGWRVYHEEDQVILVRS